MTTYAQLLTEHFDIWTAAVAAKSAAGRGSNRNLELYGLKKLRELILELAVRGLLVPQDPRDEPAAVLLKQIAAEKAKLVKEGKIKKLSKLPPIDEDEKPFELPNGWAFVRLNDIGEWGSGSTPSRGGTGLYGGEISWFKSGELNADFIYESEETVTELALEKTPLRFNKPGDVLIAMYGATIGKTSILGVPATTNQAVCACTPFNGVSNIFLLTLLKAYRPRFVGMGAGGAQPNISREKIINTIIPLPPTQEQRRIVAKVDELMVLCDRLEQQQDASIAAHQTLVRVLLAALTAAAGRDAFEAAWMRIADHFDALFTTAESVAELKQTILQLAVMGKLVPQDPADEPASVLLKKIAAEKAKLVKEGKIKKQEPLPPIREDEQPFQLPDGWEFAYTQEVCSEVTDGTHQTPTYVEVGRPFVSAQCVKPFKFMPEKCRYVSEEHYQDYIKSRKPEYRDVLLSRVGAGIGEAALIDSNLEFAIYVSTGLLKPHKDYLLPEYLVLWLNSPVGRNYSEKHTLGKGVSQGNLNLSLIRAFIVSVPPLNEQRRIVAKVDELMAFCDRLHARLAASQTTQRQLADAMTAQAIGNGYEGQHA